MRKQDHPLDVEACKNLCALMHKKYGAWLKERYFEAKSSSDNYGVFVTLTLRNGSGSFVYPVEGRMAWEDQELKPMEAANFLFDFIDSYFEEFLKEDEAVWLPIDWADYEYEGKKLQIKGQVINEAVEKMAEEFLANHGMSDSPSV